MASESRLSRGRSPTNCAFPEGLEDGLETLQEQRALRLPVQAWQFTSPFMVPVFAAFLANLPQRALSGVQDNQKQVCEAYSVLV